MKVFRVEHRDYDNLDIESNMPHILLLDTMDSDMDQYPIPPNEVFETETISCFKTSSLAEQFIEDMEEHFDTDDEYYESLEIRQYPDKDYIIREMDLPKEDIVWVDHFQIIFKYHLRGHVDI